ncbi:MAG TPA: M36 family metallopeptidase [Saprospiraceae bacterium]|nr:M36 family metallopeptidase [Saprospiraceae bacterium]
MGEFFKSIGLAVLFILFHHEVPGQDPLRDIKAYLASNAPALQAEPVDLEDLVISDSHEDAGTGLKYVYVQQRYHGIPIENALLNFTFREGKLVFANTDRLVHGISSKIKSTRFSISPASAAATALARSVGDSYLRSLPRLVREESGNKYVFQKESNIQEDIPVALIYKTDAEGHLGLYWKAGVHESSGDYWNNYIDARTGKIESRTNLVLSCFSHEDHPAGAPVAPTLPYLPFNPLATQYKVWPLPISAPNAGSPSLIADPMDLAASPLGWHDDGVQKFQITRGNNVHAYADPDSNMITANDEPNGGAGLSFDFPFNPNGTIASNKNAAVVNLFYMNNVMHDFAWHYGFTEEAGNFQAKNLSGKGRGNDWVIALSQFGANSNRHRNNADFLAPGDGSNGRMRMFVWNQSGSKLFKVIAPASLAREFETGSAEFGPNISTVPLSGKLVLVSDGSNNPTLGCKSLVNAAAVKGNIALINRGDCFFQEKVCFAQAAGAIGAIIGNYENTPITMGDVNPAPCSVNIPSLSVSSLDFAFLKNNIQTITVSFQAPATVNVDKDASFDNGIIAHEYGHGISIRLTGGPSNSGCLGNDEQMGEGWSDFFTLATTVKAGDNRNTQYGIGTYPLQQDVSGRGIRKYPYSLDFGINNLTYEDILTTETPHSLGEVWTMMLWELYWAMSETYGWDANLYKGTGGNNKAIRLVFEGLKLQPCNPGFVDGRDAILQADKLLYNGENECLIWKAFAKRGLGFSAKQGSSSDRSDGVEAFDLPPSCIPTVKISKKMTPLIKAGDDIAVSLTVRNDSKVAARNVLVTDLVPEGATYKPSSSNVPLAQSGSTLSHSRTELLPGESMVINYSLQSNKSKASRTAFIDSMENTEFDYDVLPLKGTGIWELTEVLSRSGKKSWFVPNRPTENDQLLNRIRSLEIKNMAKPVLRFYHRYNVQNAFDGGLVRISTDGGFNFSDAGSAMFRNGYNGPLSYFAIPIPDLRAFYGDSKTFIPTFIDLSEYNNQEIRLQFRFGSNDSKNATGWFIDDLEVFDMVNYNSEACVVAEGFDPVCAEAPEKGTIVESQLSIPTRKEDPSLVRVQVFPNPAQGIAYCTVDLPQGGRLDGQILGLDGRIVSTFMENLTGPSTRIKLSLDGLAPGLYMVQVKSGNYTGREKLVVQ